MSPELLDAGREQAAHWGVEVEWQQADAEALSCADGEFDVVLSCVGVMFAPRHLRSAYELIGVCRRGGLGALAELARRHGRGTETAVMDWEYLLSPSTIAADRARATPTCSAQALSTSRCVAEPARL